MIERALQTILEHRDLPRAEARALLHAIFQGAGNDPQLAAVLIALKMKGETVEELVGFAEAMREAVTDIGRREDEKSEPCVDTCGTGGSARHMLNVSTAAAIVTAGAGATVAKHGNRSNTSVCGSADVLEALGVNLEYPAGGLGGCLRDVGLAFLYAPLLHASMKRVAPVRKALRVRTIFNLLGPLTNPAGADSQIVGVSGMDLLPIMAEALLRLGTRHSLVVRSEDGMGELSVFAPNRVAEVRASGIRQYKLNPVELGFARAEGEALACASLEEAVQQLKDVLHGQPGAARDMVCLNAAAALLVHGQARDWRAGLEQARAAIDSGAAWSKLEALAAYTHGRHSAAAKIKSE